MLTESDFIALNALYLKKVATEAHVVEVTGLAPDDIARFFAAAAEQGWLMDMGPEGAMILEEGMEQVTTYYRDVYSDLRTDPALAAWYQNFESMNKRFIAAVTAWQNSDGDERDEGRVLQTGERLAKSIGQLVPKMPRYETYSERLERSIQRVDEGEKDFVCKPTVDSVPSIWFEFHEDILTVLGRPRDTT